MKNKVWGVKKSTIQFIEREIPKMSLETKLEKFQAFLNISLAVFQFIEERIKTYLDNCFVIVKVRTENIIPFDFNFRDVSNSPLQKLLPLFRKYCSNNNLISKIDMIKSDRDFLAHRGFLTIYGPMREDEEKVTINLEKAVFVSDQVKFALNELNKEVSKIEKIRNDISKS